MENEIAIQTSSDPLHSSPSSEIPFYQKSAKQSIIFAFVQLKMARPESLGKLSYLTDHIKFAKI